MKIQRMMTQRVRRKRRVRGKATREMNTQRVLKTRNMRKVTISKEVQHSWKRAPNQGLGTSNTPAYFLPSSHGSSF
jgi:hypothetical protein